MTDSILNSEMRPVFVDIPSEVKRRLSVRYPKEWTHVFVGETMTAVTITEYLYEDKFRDVRDMLNELLRKQDLSMYKRNPKRLAIYVDASARKIIELVLKDLGENK